MAISGTKTPMIPWMLEIHRTSELLNVSKVNPLASTISRTFSMAVIVGTPAAPKATGVEFNISVTIAAAIGGNPRPTSSGAASAAGVPKPATPSIKAPNIHPMMMTCIRLSSVILSKPSLIL